MMSKTRLTLVAIFAAFLTACEPYAEQLSVPVLPDELKDCKFYMVSANGRGYMTVVRCPNSTTSTTYNTGKSQYTTVVIDGQEYVKK